MSIAGLGYGLDDGTVVAWGYGIRVPVAAPLSPFANLRHCIQRNDLNAPEPDLRATRTVNRRLTWCVPSRTLTDTQPGNLAHNTPTGLVSSRRGAATAPTGAPVLASGTGAPVLINVERTRV